MTFADCLIRAFAIGVSFLSPPNPMEYKVVPFAANVQSHEGASAAAGQLQSVIASQASQGWEYVRLEHVETNIAGSNGCFGIGASPAQTIHVSMAVFQR
jgi:hypothetical protein